MRRSAVAPTGPMPGMLIRRCATSLPRSQTAKSRSISRSRTWVSSACCDSVPTILAASNRHLRYFTLDDLPRHQQRPFQPFGDVDAEFGE